MKEISELNEIERQEEKKQVLEAKKDLIEQVQDQREYAAVEVEKVKQEKKRVRDEINKEITEALQRKREEEEHERAKREELIRQIRELEKIPIQRTKGFDPTETAGYGLLEEMSIAELRERIERQKLAIDISSSNP